MDKAILLAIAASVCTATASLCQRKGAKDNETAGFDARLLVRLARQPVWLLGIAAMIGGFIFQITALRYGDLALVQPILAAELLFVFGYLAVAGARRVTGRDLLAAAAMSAGIGVFLRLAAPSGGRLHAPGSSWLLAGLITAGVVVAALAVAFGLGRRPGASRGRRAAVLGAATGISWGFMAAVIKELSSHLGDGLGAIVSAWSLYVLLRRRGGDHAAGLARAGGRAAGRLPARVHHPRPAVRQPARRVLVRRAHPDRCGRPGRRGAGAGRGHRRRCGAEPQLPDRRRERASGAPAPARPQQYRQRIPGHPPAGGSGGPARTRQLPDPAVGGAQPGRGGPRRPDASRSRPRRGPDRTTQAGPGKSRP